MASYVLMAGYGRLNIIVKLTGALFAVAEGRKF
jgi:hypothetical protein